MQESTPLLNKLLGYLKGFLKNMPSPLSGWDMQDVKVNQKGDSFSSYFSFNNEEALKDTRTGENIKDVTGGEIQLNVLLSAINGKKVLAPLLNGLNNMTGENVKDGKKLLKVLLGDSKPGAGNAGTTSPGTERLQAAKDAGAGLLGFDLNTYKNRSEFPKSGESYGGKVWSWNNIATEFLQYSLECESPGKNYGAMENIPIQKCSQLISEYLLHEDIIGAADEVQINYVTLVLPILIRIQDMLCAYFVNAYDNVAGVQEVDNTDTTAEDKAEAEAQKKAEQEAAAKKAQEAQQVEDNLFKNTQQAPYRPGVSQSQAQQLFPTASKQITVTLKKIQGSTDFDVLALQSNYSPVETLDDLDEIVVQDQFMDTITEDPQTFAIMVDDDGYDIDTCEACEIDPCESLGCAMQAAISMYRNLYILHWMARGNDMMKTHLLSEDMYSELIQEIDTLGELMVEKCGRVIPLTFDWEQIGVQDYEFQEALDVIQTLINGYLASLDYAYPNQTTDVQSTIDEWLRYWNKQLNYFVKRQEI